MQDAEHRTQKEVFDGTTWRLSDLAKKTRKIAVSLKAIKAASRRVALRQAPFDKLKADRTGRVRGEKQKDGMI